VKNQTLISMVSGCAEDQKNFQMVLLKNIHNSNTINLDNSTQETTRLMTYWLENSSPRKTNKNSNPLMAKLHKL
jgi:hypothetical protein